jgi:hypothetical protein
VVNQTLPAFGHSWGEWGLAKQAACEENGYESRTCMICAETENKEIAALGHDFVLKEIAPDDGVNGEIYYVCTRNCGKCAVCEVSETGEKSIGEVCTSEEVYEKTTEIPATSFNTYNRVQSNYNYVNRGASLRIDNNSAADVQALRFTSSMLVPNGATVEDFGYIVTREDYFTSLKNFVLGGNKVAGTSLKNGKYSTFQTDKGEVKTFNIVIGVQLENWSYKYIARPYIIYSFAGETYTVYDQCYSERSVDMLAQSIVNSPNETNYVKNYIQSKIIDR